jgi:hypothetical protein
MPQEKFSQIPDATRPLSGADRVTGLQDGENANFSAAQLPAGNLITTVTDGTTSVTPVTTINFTGGASVMDAGGGEAAVAISGGAGAWTLVGTQTSDGTYTEFAFTGLSPTKHYKLIVNILSVTTSSGTWDPVLQLGSGAGPTWHTAAADYDPPSPANSVAWQLIDGEGLSISDLFASGNGPWIMDIDVWLGYGVDLRGAVTYTTGAIYGIATPPQVSGFGGGPELSGGTPTPITGIKIAPQGTGVAIAAGSTASLYSLP